MRSLSIGLDMDGVFSNFNPAYHALLHRMKGSPFDGPANYDQWHWEAMHGFTSDHVHQAWKEINADPTFWRDLPPLATRTQLDWLGGLGYTAHDPYIITHRPVNARGVTSYWVKFHGHMGGLGKTTVLCTAHKGHLAYALELDVMVDDKPQNLQEVLKYRGRGTRCLLIDQPWNKSFSHPYIQRVDLDGAIEIVQKMEGK